MKIVKCVEGHGYDSEKFDACPMCAKIKEAGKKAKVVKVKAVKRSKIETPEIKAEEPKKAEIPEIKAEQPKAETPKKAEIPEIKAEQPKAEIPDIRTEELKKEASVQDNEKKFPPPPQLSEEAKAILEEPVRFPTTVLSRDDLDALYVDKDIEQAENIVIDDVNNMAIAKNGTLLIKYIGTNEAIHIPDGIVYIGKYAFRGNTSAKKIIMSDSVKTVDKFAFAHCVNLEEIVFSKNLETIGENAFLKCQRMKELNFPNSLKTIGKGAFGRCSSIRKLTFPAQLKKISDLSFFSCRNLNRVIISHPVETIGSWAFYGCNNLTNVKISIQTKDIRDDAFCGCENIYNVHVMEFDGVDYNASDVKKGHKLILRVLKQINRKKAERYAREHGLSMLFI